MSAGAAKTAGFAKPANFCVSLTCALLVVRVVSSRFQISSSDFSRVAVGAGLRVTRVSFSSDGVAAGSAQHVPAPDSDAIAARWSTLAAAHQIDLVVCAT